MREELSQKKLNFGVSVNVKPLFTSDSKSEASCVVKTTRCMGSFPKTAIELEDFKRYLTSLDGGNKKESTADLVTKDVSKFLYYCNPKKIDWDCFLDKSQHLKYFEYLKKIGVGPEGRLTKLDRTYDGFRYLKMCSPENTDKMHIINSL